MLIDIDEKKEAVILEFSFSYFYSILRDLNVQKNKKFSKRPRAFHEFPSTNSFLKALCEAGDMKLAGELHSKEFRERVERRKELYDFDKFSKAWLDNLKENVLTMFLEILNPKNDQQKSLNELKDFRKGITKDIDDFKEKLGKKLFLRSIIDNQGKIK